jgi:TatD DNase family protein
MRLFDTHCHLDVAAFDADRADVLHAARSAGIQHLLIPAIQRDGWEKLLALCAADQQLYPALGLHPVMLEQHTDNDIQTLARQIQQQRPVAIGEIGLDYAIKSLDKNKQQNLFEAQLKLAEQHQLPVILHVRKAHDAILQTLKRYQLPGGICHAFNGSLQQAEQYIGLGFKLGFGGMLTYPKANKLHKLARELPLEAVVLETDAPDMTGIAHRYQRNSPAYLPEVAEKLAELRDISLQEVANTTTQNTCSLLLG